MEICEFDYNLPNKLIAQTPLEKRDESRLMVLDKKTGEVKDCYFKNILDYLEEGDTLVLNDTKVLPARLIGQKEKTGGVVEILLLKNKENDTWECLAKPARRLHQGDIIVFGNGELKAYCSEVKEEGIRYFTFQYQGIFYEILDKLGTMPLPPYIHEKLQDKNRYQTVYAKEVGSAAAPTAGLHFTEELLNKIKSKKINVVFITLHVGLGTFRPVLEDKVEDHKMHSEYYQMSKEVARILNKTRQDNHKIIAVGTTTTRTLETIYQKYQEFREDRGFTDIFIYPGIPVLSIDGLITNFHLPKSTLLMLVSAIAGKDNILNAYKIAVKKEYRFFSFGDAMFIH